MCSSAAIAARARAQLLPRARAACPQVEVDHDEVDLGLDDLYACADARRPVFERRSSTLTYHMRAAKKLRVKASRVEEVQVAADRVNADHAVRKSDLLDLRANRARKCSGWGGLKRRWIPEAVLRACYGKGISITRRKGKYKTKVAAVLAGATTVLV